jgi:peptide/nickel transport system ATP-binding protein
VETPDLVRTEKLVTNFYTFEGVVRALNGVSLVVKEGETYGLVGESGCGKSVTVRSMMRIVPAPGRIDAGRILVFLTPEDRRAGVDIVRRTEAYMESIRGCDISMIFQEPSAALNPVLTVSEQVEESYRFHRLDTILSEVIATVRAERGALPPLAPARGWKALQEALFARELSALRRRDETLREIDAALAALEETGASTAAARRAQLNRLRDRTRARSFAVAVARRTPVLRRYRRRLTADIRGHVVELMRSLGIANPENVARRYPHELSGGMQQRIVIAIALACHPTLLIADEPTSNLDVTIQAQIVELIRTLKKTTISSVLFITHDLGLVAEICDRVTVMYAGDVCETASVKDLFREPLHPYTRGLLAAVPRASGGKRDLATIPGAVPNLIHPPAGCRFHPRCAHAMETCRQEKPSLLEQGPGHHVACHLYGPVDGGRTGSTQAASAQGAPRA